LPNTQTPILTASSPEGARDFLVPSRIHPGQFYALPQAPQQYKQLLMVAGFDRYFQIAPCFRDEDPRADRLPGEFYQLDLEMSFVTQEEVWDTMEPVILRRVRAIRRRQACHSQSFRRIPYDDAVRKYGTDKPDLRNPIEMQAASEHFRRLRLQGLRRHDRKIPKVEVWAIPAKTGGSRAFCDRMNSWAQGQGQPGLGYIFWREEGDNLEGAGPIAKNIGPERTEAIRIQLGLEDGDACFFVAGDPPSSPVCRRCPHPRRRRAEPCRSGSLRAVLDCRFPVLRMGRGRQAGGIRPQPVFHAAGWHGSARDPGSADPQGLSV
jgi:aspartyl-tRNA synthetase